jgi:hypothetical protein
MSYVAILEDDVRRQERMLELLPGLLPDLAPILFDNAPEMVAWLPDNLDGVSLICLDHDLGPNRRNGDGVFNPGCGRDVANYLATRMPCCPVVIHTTNYLAAPGMVSELEGAGWRVERVIPFSDLEWIGSAWVKTIRDLC